MRARKAPSARTIVVEVPDEVNSDAARLKAFLKGCKPPVCLGCGAGRGWRGHGPRERKISIIGEAFTGPSSVYRVRCLACRTVWQVQPAQILRYRRYSTSLVAGVLERRAAGDSYSELEQVYGLSNSVLRDWVGSFGRGAPEIVNQLANWASKAILNWSPPARLCDGGLRALFGLVASLQEARLCPQRWMEWIQIWAYVAGPGYLIPATKFCGGRSP